MFSVTACKLVYIYMSYSTEKRWYIWKTTNNVKKCFRQKLYDIDEGHTIYSSILPSDDLKRSRENQIKISKSTSFITYFRRWNWDISLTSPTRAFHPLSRYEIQIRCAIPPTLALLYIHKRMTAGYVKIFLIILLLVWYYLNVESQFPNVFKTISRYR